MNDKFYKIMFFLGALWNIVGGFLCIILPKQIFSISNLTPPEQVVYYQAWVALFVVLGIGFIMVSRDLYGNKNIVILGIIGKLAFATISYSNVLFFGQKVPIVFMIGAIVDLVFVVLFFMFLHYAKKIGK